MAKIRAVIFDMDGTLIDSEPIWQRSEIEVFATFGVALTKADVLKTVGIRLDQVVQFWFEQKPWQGASLEEVEQKIVERVSSVISEQGEGTPGALAAIRYFADKGYPLAIASVSYLPIIEATVKRLGVSEYFKVIHSAQFEKLGKPDPAVYITTAKKLAVDPRECLVFEDTIAGIKAAKAAGMICAAVKEHSTPFEKAQKLADYSLESFLQLEQAPWLKELGI